MRWRCCRPSARRSTICRSLPEAPGYYHPGRSAVLRLGPTILAQFGELHPDVLKACDVKGPAVGFEVFLDRMPLPRSKGSRRGRCSTPRRSSRWSATSRSWWMRRCRPTS